MTPDGLGHPDALARAPLGEVARRVVDVVRKVRPQVIVTFDPIGGYHHPDHVAIHRATVLAFQAAAEAGRFPDLGPPFAPQKLYTGSRPGRSCGWRPPSCLGSGAIRDGRTSARIGT